jgi:putative membrane protein
MWEGHGLMGGGFMWLFWIALIVFVVWGISAATGSGTGKGTGVDKSALEILKERYARGEIDKQEFEDKKRDLMG